VQGFIKDFRTIDYRPFASGYKTSALTYNGHDDYRPYMF